MCFRESNPWLWEFRASNTPAKLCPQPCPKCLIPSPKHAKHCVKGDTRDTLGTVTSQRKSTPNQGTDYQSVLVCVVSIQGGGMS